MNEPQEPVAAKTRVAVIFGGRSPEHAVSCLGAGHIMAALDPSRYEVVPVGITRDGRWVLASGDPARLAVTSGGLPSVDALAAPGTEVAARLDPLTRGLVVTPPGEVPHSLGEVDVVLPLLHGFAGEDGTIQGLLEMAGTPYVGAGVLASAASMDKEYMKLVFAARGLPIVRHVVVRDRDWRLTDAEGSAVHRPNAERKRVLDEISELGLPVFVKPARGGSSIGTSRVTDATGLEDAIELAREHDLKVIVEAAAAGMEVECAVLEGAPGRPPEASLPAQVLVGGDSEFYDFRAKYLEADTRLVIPPPIPDEAVAEVRRLACAAFEAVSCEGLARVDFFYTPQHEIIVNEINTMPGMTPGSGFPLMWEATGVPLPELMDRIIATALRKQPGLR
ncbi:MAG TPA: D-alanine--D-alanine ligase family protein [Streptosporangiaceae bacterium]|nr:D-alanine--D-alanine ligase family protein [Streptosporangiaceae bacterium]